MKTDLPLLAEIEHDPPGPNQSARLLAEAKLDAFREAVLPAENYGITLHQPRGLRDLMAAAEAYKARPLPERILEIVQQDWATIRGFIEPYSEGAALETVLNELVDYAREKGFRVRDVMRDDNNIESLVVG